MSRYSLLRPCAFALAPLSTALLFGAEVLASESLAYDPLLLPPLVISHGRAQVSEQLAAPLQSPLTLTADPKQARQPMPAADGADYLKTIPGFSAVRNGGANGDPVFRGMIGSRLNILSDGGLMLGACPNRMDAPTSYLSPENFDRLTVIKGPQTVLWGPGASAATILFERDTPRFGELGARVNGSLMAGSNGRVDRRIDATAGGREGYLRLLANKAQADDYQDGDGSTVPSRWAKWNSDMQLGWTPGEDTLVELSAGRGDGEARYAGRGMDGSRFLREGLGLRFKRENIGPLFQGFEGQLYYNYADHIMDNYSLRTPPTTGMMAGEVFSRVDRRTLGGRLLGTWQWDAWQLKGGVDAQRSEHRRVMNPSGPANQTTSLASGAWDMPWVPDALMHNYGLFAELQWSLSERQRVVGGLRLDLADARDLRQFFRSHVPGSMPLVSANWDNPSADETRRNTLYSGFLRYEERLAEQPINWYAGLGHVERFPDYWELFVANPGPVGTAQPFTTVRPEKTTQLDVGLEYGQGDLRLWLSAYAGVVEDYILFTSVPGLMPGMSRSQVDNIDATIAGAELGVSYSLTQRWKTDASLAWAWGENRSEGHALAQMPPLEARLGLTYERDDWSASALWRGVAAQNRVALEQGNVVGKDFGPSAGFAVFSVNAVYRLSPQMKLSAGVDNLFDKAYSEHLNLAGNAGFGYAASESLNEPGRTLWTKLDFSF